MFVQRLEGGLWSLYLTQGKLNKYDKWSCRTGLLRCFFTSFDISSLLLSSFDMSPPLQSGHWVTGIPTGRDFLLKTSTVAKDGEIGHFVKNVTVLGGYRLLDVQCKRENIIMGRTNK